MPAPIDDITKRRAVQQWLSGDSRPKIAIDNNLGEGTGSGFVRDFKIGLDSSEFDSTRELALEVMKQGLTMSELSSHVRLYNFIKSSGAEEDKIESFIANVSYGDISPENIVQYVTAGIIRTAFAQGAILAPGQESPHRNPSQGFSPPGQVDTFPGGNPGQCISFDPRLHDNDCYAR
jgi:hypothetical protein